MHNQAKDIKTTAESCTVLANPPQHCRSPKKRLWLSGERSGKQDRKQFQPAMPCHDSSNAAS